MQKRVSRFSFENFLSHSAEKFRGGTLQCFRKFQVSENFMHKKGISLFSVENFLSLTVPNKLVWEPFSVSEIRKFRVSKKFMYQRGGGGITFFRREFLSYSTEKVCRGTLLSSRKFGVSRNFMDKRGGGYHVVPSKIFCLTLPKNFVGEPFLVSENFWYRNFSYKREGGGVAIFRRNN